MKPLTVRELFEAKQQSLGLELLTDPQNLERTIDGPAISSPGLVLAGYTERFPHGRIQVLGETEVSYLRSLPPDRLQAALEAFFALDLPAVFITKGLEVPPLLVELARQRGIPVIRSRLKTGEFYRRMQAFLEDHFAPSTTVHGSLADVYGVGLLFVGRSGIGKSECVLDLVERGHRDGVGIDEWVLAEYARVRRFYDEMGIGERTAIALFNGPHRVDGAEAVRFLRRWVAEK